MRNICISIVGPTAIGKSAIALQLAKHFSAPIISADSRQCFIELNIGVAKPSPLELKEVEHFFINAHHIWDEVTAASFEKDALKFCEKSFQNSNVVIMAGGSGLYVKSFLQGMDEIAPVNESIRNEITAGFETGGLPWVQEKLKIEDPSFFANGEIHNPHRCMRALEVVRQTGKSILSLQIGLKRERPFDVLKIGLELPREQLYKRINNRVDEMIAAGLEKEVRNLIPYRNSNALQTVGYSELFHFFDNEISLSQAVELIKKNTRHYAKRQLTWFKKDPQIHWMPATPQGVIDFVNMHLQNKSAP